MNNRCILLIEDEESDIELLQFAFKRAGITHSLCVVPDGQAAMDYLSGASPCSEGKNQPPPCLIILDLKLPRVGGLEFLSWLRQQPTHKQTVVIIFSSSAQPSDVERAYALGANSFIEKPSDLQATLRLIQTLKAWWLDLNRFAPG